VYVESPLKRFRNAEFTPGSEGGRAVPCDQAAMRKKLKRVRAFKMRRGPLIASRDRRAHQGLMEERVGPLNRLGGLFGKTHVIFPTVGNEAGDPVAKSHELGSDRGQLELEGGTVAPADMLFGREYSILCINKSVKTIESRSRLYDGDGTTRQAQGSKMENFVYSDARRCA